MNEQPESLRLADALMMGDAMIPSIDLPEAAAELRRLHAEVETLRADRDSWRQQASDRVDDAVRFAEERDKLRAEVGALRADAERYRWLQNEATGDLWDAIEFMSPEQTDFAIDAARWQA